MPDACPRTVLESRNPVIRAVVDVWRAGGVCWEQALLLMVVELEKQNERYAEATRGSRGLSGVEVKEGSP